MSLPSAQGLTARRLPGSPAAAPPLPRRISPAPTQGTGRLTAPLSPPREDDHYGYEIPAGELPARLLSTYLTIQKRSVSYVSRFSQGAVDFLWGVRFNNERSWFEAHKQEYLDLVIAPSRSWAARSMPP